MNKIIISLYGSGIAVGLEGSKEFLERQTNRFYNYGGMTRTGEFYKESDRFGYFISTEEDVVASLAAETFVRFLMDGTSKKYKKNPEGLKEATNQIAQEIFDSFERENFMGKRSEGAARIGAVAQNGRAEVWEEDFKPAR